ncbi:hypothetical protein OAO01_07105 [Oligoflexia bacterium]|nr:hypothetical protein [Oligoflexia bacterium]
METKLNKLVKSVRDTCRDIGKRVSVLDQTAARASNDAMRTCEQKVVTVLKGAGQVVTKAGQQLDRSVKRLNPIGCPEEQCQSQGCAEAESERAIVKDRTTDNTALPKPTFEEVSSAVFSGRLEKVTFTRALVDLTDQDEEIRTQAAHDLGTIHHALSVRTLAVQLNTESSPKVRQACESSLITLDH